MPPARFVLGLLILVLLANLAGGAQCVVRCADPLTPPPCHHHSPQNQSRPTPQVCATDMTLAESRSPAMPALQPAIGNTITAGVVAESSEPLLPPESTPIAIPSTVLRI